MKELKKIKNIKILTYFALIKHVRKFMKGGSSLNGCVKLAAKNTAFILKRTHPNLLPQIKNTSCHFSRANAFGITNITLETFVMMLNYIKTGNKPW